MLLLLEAGGSWAEVEPLLNKLEHTGSRRATTKSFWQMYLRTGHFEEALLAAKYWTKETTAWVVENREVAQQALNIANESLLWHLTPGPHHFNSTPEERMANTRKLRELGGHELKTYRDSRAALMLTEHLIKKSKSAPGAKAVNLNILKNMRHVPMHRWDQRFDFDFVRQFGVSESKFAKICQQAEELL